MVQTLKDIECDTFYNMLVSAGLVETLREKNLTIFCPSDEALKELDEETNVSLLYNFSVTMGWGS